MLHSHQLDSIDVFDRCAPRFAATIGKLTNYDACYDALLALLREGDNVLDLACGPGNVAQYLRRHKSLSITGYDLSETMLKLAQENVPDGIFQKQSILDFTVDRRFDAVVNAFGLPFLDEEQRLLSFACCAQALREGGLFFLSFMEGSHSGFEKTSFSPDQEIYFHYHRKAEVLEELDSLGFKLLQKWELPFDNGEGGKLQDVVLILRSRLGD